MLALCPPRGHSIASVARSAGLHPLRISLYARAAGSRDAFIVSVSLQYIYIYLRWLAPLTCQCHSLALRTAGATCSLQHARPRDQPRHEAQHDDDGRPRAPRRAGLARTGSENNCRPPAIDDETARVVVAPLGSVTPLHQARPCRPTAGLARSQSLDCREGAAKRTRMPASASAA